MSERASRTWRILPAAVGLALALASGPAQSQVPVPIVYLNDNLPQILGVTLPVEGDLLADGERLELWTHFAVSSRTTPADWYQRVVLVDGGGLLPDMTPLNGARMQVIGQVSAHSLPPAIYGTQEIAEISVVSFTVLDLPLPDPPDLPVLPAPPPPADGEPPCDPCQFVLIVGGDDDSLFWNDAVQKYAYATGTLNACPDNVVVLFDGGSKDPLAIPHGSSAGSPPDLLTGGAFDCSRDTVDAAFEYLRQSIDASGCTYPVLSFHATGHGAGYHTAADQDVSSPEGEGFSGARVDLDGDEQAEVAEEDLRFEKRGSYDLDGDGQPDLLVYTPPGGTLTVLFDEDGDGALELGVGVDTNGDGAVDSADALWGAPDLDRDPNTDAVGFDEVIALGDGEVLVDDELRGLLGELQARTALSRWGTQVELGGCYSGGFQDDLSQVALLVATAASEGELGYGISMGSGEGYGLYEKAFIAALDAGKSWAEAHDLAADYLVLYSLWWSATKGEPMVQTPTFSSNAFVDLGFGLEGTHGIPVLEGTGTLAAGSQVDIEVSNALGSTLAYIVAGIQDVQAAFKGGVLVPDPSAPGIILPLPTSPSGHITINTVWPTVSPQGIDIFIQVVVADPGALFAWALSNAIQGITP